MKARLIELARELDDHSFTINDGYLGRKAAELLAMAEAMEDDDD